MNDVVLTGGRYGLGSKDTPPSSVFAIYTELEKADPKPRSPSASPMTSPPYPSRSQARSDHLCSRHQRVQVLGLGGDGTVGANKNSTKIIGDHTDKYIQAYFQYDSKKTGGVTITICALATSPSEPLLHQPG